jgi:hypothetical protein
VSDYPRRESFFAYRYCRLLAKTCAAMELGPDGCWMLSVIAMLEDTKRYSDAVLYYNGQLMAVTGFTREHTMIDVRKRAVQSGWLHYEPGGKRKPGRYWVTIPERFADIPDGACDDADLFPDDSVSESGLTDDFVSGNRRETAGKASVKPQGKRQPFYPIPKPTPTHANGRSNRKYSAEFEAWYLAYPRRVAKGAAAKAYAKAAAAVGHEKLLEAVTLFAASEEANSEYCPHPATWLNADRYDDDPAEWNGHKSPKRCATPEELAEWTP